MSNLIVTADDVTLKDLTVANTADNAEWSGTYAIQFYDVTGGVLENVKATGANAGVLVNGSNVTVKSGVDVSGNTFGGIEVSDTEQSKNPESRLTVESKIANTTERFGRPTVWTDGDNAYVDDKSGMASSDAISAGQVQYYNDAANINTIEIDDTTSLAEAFAAMPAGGTVKLASDTSSATVAVTKDVTLDLNGKKLSATGSGNVFQVNGGTLTIDDPTASQPVVSADGQITYTGGSIESAKGQTITLHNGGKVIINNGHVNCTNNVAIYAVGNNNPETSDDKSEIISTIEMNGGWVEAREFAVGVQGRGATAHINGGVLEAHDNAVVAGNGTNSASQFLGDTHIVIDGANLVGHTISAGYIGCGVYLPQRGDVTIKNSDIYVDKGMGVLVRGGTVNIENTNIKTLGTDSGKVGDSKVMNGCYGVCVDVASNYYDSKNISVTLTNVDIETESESVKANPEEEPNISKIHINSGTFSTDHTVYAGDKSVTPEGGKFKVA